MKKAIQVLWISILAVSMAAAATLTSASADAVDLTKTCSITVTMLSPDRGKPIDNMAFIFYQAGEIDTGGGYNLSFKPFGPFEDSGVSFEDMTESKAKRIALELAAYADSNDIEGEPGITDSDGKVTFTTSGPVSFLSSQVKTIYAPIMKAPRFLWEHRLQTTAAPAGFMIWTFSRKPIESPLKPPIRR